MGGHQATRMREPPRAECQRCSPSLGTAPTSTQQAAAGPRRRREPACGRCLGSVVRTGPSVVRQVLGDGHGRAQDVAVLVDVGQDEQPRAGGDPDLLQG